MTLLLQFLGAAQTVTGSKFLLHGDQQKILIDCGLFQGLKELRLRNWNPLPIDPAKIDMVILTHAHIDHTGYLPRLIQQGFQGKVYCTPATNELLGIMLPDSGHLQEEQAAYANKKEISRHHPALPLYTEAQARTALKYLHSVDYATKQQIAPDIYFRYQANGHILGSAFVELVIGETHIVFSGDLGSYTRDVMQAPNPLPKSVDYLVIESTYGGISENHRPIAEQIRQAVQPVLAQGGIVVIPAFAVGRASLVLYHLNQLQNRGAIPDVPIYIDSPMATDAAEVYYRFGKEHNLKIDLLRDAERNPLRTAKTSFIRKPEDSKQLNTKKGPYIIISSSGMATGGRVLHHLKHKLPNSQNMILLVGYQAEGTRGRRLLHGEKAVKIFGEMVPVNAKIAVINGLSAHGDTDDLLRWLKTSRVKPKRIFLVHGEKTSLAAMSKLLGEAKYSYYVPHYMEKVDLP